MTSPRLAAGAGVALALLACREAPPPSLPGAELRARVEARLERDRDALAASLGHYALVDSVAQPDLHAFMAQIFPQRVDGELVMSAVGGLAQLSGEIERQAAMVGYINAFYLLAITGFVALPFIMLVQRPRGG